MLNSLRLKYGEHIEADYYSFPDANALRAATVEDLTSMGFGYRAKYVVGTVHSLFADSDTNFREFLSTLRLASEGKSDEIVENLKRFPGVGPKVADCVALFSCNCLDVVPVDVHVFEIAKRDYDPAGRLTAFKTVNKQAYKLVVETFRQRFGPFAGWAHSVLFTCELIPFRERLGETASLKTSKPKAKRKPRVEERCEIPMPHLSSPVILQPDSNLDGRRKRQREEK